jgi:hypothetical protein
MFAFQVTKCANTTEKSEKEVNALATRSLMLFEGTSGFFPAQKREGNNVSQSKSRSAAPLWDD